MNMNSVVFSYEPHFAFLPLYFQINEKRFGFHDRWLKFCFIMVTFLIYYFSMPERLRCGSIFISLACASVLCFYSAQQAATSATFVLIVAFTSLLERQLTVWELAACGRQAQPAAAAAASAALEKRQRQGKPRGSRISNFGARTWRRGKLVKQFTKLPGCHPN